MKSSVRIPGVGLGLTPPAWPRGLRELAVPFEILRLAVRWSDLPTTVDGRGATVMLLPGFGAPEISLLALDRYLRRRGHDPVSWGLGRNRGNVPELMPLVAARVKDLARQRGGPIALVGWSLGGYLAREAARDMPDAVRHVVTIGSPVVGGPKYTAVASYYRRLGVDVDDIEAAVAERYGVPIRVPVTAIYSRSDGVVDWRACIDTWSPRVEHIAVDASHVGLGFSPDVLRIVAERLVPRSRKRRSRRAAPRRRGDGDEPFR